LISREINGVRMSDFKDFLYNRITSLNEWLSKNDWKAYDPFDGLSSGVLNCLTFRNHYLRILVQQSVRRFPLNLRPVLGIRKKTSSKGMGFCALGYLKLYEGTGDQDYLRKVKVCLNWLKDNYSHGYSGYAWGNHFSYESRAGRIPLGVPTIVWTSLIAGVFLDAYEVLGETDYLDVARSSCDFLVNDIGRYEGPHGSICFMYTPYHENKPCIEGHIHNANVLAACLLARMYKNTGDEQLFALSKRAMQYTVHHQLPEGGWYYGTEKKYWWIDSFHTGYVLESLYGYLQATNDRSYEKSLLQGFEYFVSNFFEENGTPKYYSHKTYPIDIQCSSQAIQALVNLREYNSNSTDIAKRVSYWTLKNMQDPQGFFYFRKYPLVTNKTPMFHWGQATMLSALSHLLAVL
jgi:rhamnogalacturonyl hydrolase YesR